MVTVADAKSWLRPCTRIKLPTRCARRDTKSTPPRPITGRSEFTMTNVLVCGRRRLSSQPVDEIPMMLKPPARCR